MTNVKSLPNATTLPNKPVEEVVKILEDFLRLAKDGEIRQIAICGTDQRSGTRTVFSGQSDIFPLLGGIEYLGYRIKKIIDE